MVNLARIDKNVYKSLGFKNKSIGQTMIKEVLQTKVTKYKTIHKQLEHAKKNIKQRFKKKKKLSKIIVT